MSSRNARSIYRSESLEPRRLLTTLIVHATSGDDVIDIKESGPSNIEITINGTSTLYADSTFDDIRIEGEAGSDTINIANYKSNPLTVWGEGGDDEIVVGTLGQRLSILTAPLTVDGGAGGATFRIRNTLETTNTLMEITSTTFSPIVGSNFEPISYSNLTEFIYHGSALIDSMLLYSLPAPSAFFVANGSDHLSISTGALNHSLHYDGGIGAGIDDVWYFDLLSPNPSTWDITGTQINRTGAGELEALQTEELEIYMSDGNDQLTFDSDKFSTVKIDAGNGVDTIQLDSVGADSQVTVYGGVGADVIDVESTAAGSLVSIFGSTGADDIHLANVSGNLTPIAGSIVVNGDDGNDELVLHDNTTAGTDTYILGAAGMLRNNGFGGVLHTNIEEVRLLAQSGSNAIGMTGSAAGVSTTINAGAGNDTIGLASTGTDLSTFLGSVSILGTGGTDQVNLLDTNKMTDETYVFSDTSLTVGTSTIASYSGVERVEFTAGKGSDDIVVTAASAVTQVVRPNDGDDDTDIFASTIPVQYMPSLGADRLELNADGGPVASATMMGSDYLTWLFVGNGSLLTLANQITLQVAFQTHVGAVSFGTRSTMIGSVTPNDARTAVAQGYAGGAWNGTVGAFASHAAAASAASDGIGYALAGDLNITQYNNVQVQPDDMIFTHTLNGDVNLSRNVDFNDLLRLAQNYGASGRYWHQGDFNYEGNVNFNDLLPLAQNYGTTLVVSGKTGPLSSTRPARVSDDLFGQREI
ncbi:MAG TPA: hypothetical protein PK402_05590 [Tepidisphaeraceae bacterium]|nr:hypothetical protein [Tepidisphaeraceae bacterium]